MTALGTIFVDVGVCTVPASKALLLLLHGGWGKTISQLRDLSPSPTHFHLVDGIRNGPLVRSKSLFLGNK